MKRNSIFDVCTYVRYGLRLVLSPTYHKILWQTLESSLKRKDSLSLKRTLSREDAKEEPVWEETENILRRVERDSIQEEFHACQFPHKDTRLLHLEIEELKQKLWEKDGLLETMAFRPSQSTRQLTFEEKEISEKDSHLEVATKHASGEDRGVADKDPMRLQAMVEKLQHELWEKDCYVQSANLQLHEQQVLLSRTSIVFLAAIAK